MLLSSSFGPVIKPPHTYSFLRPTILLSILFSDSLSLLNLSFIRVRDKGLNQKRNYNNKMYAISYLYKYITYLLMDRFVTVHILFRLTQFTTE